MIRRYRLCEGPEDLVALREIAMSFGARRVPREPERGAGGSDRTQRLRNGDALIDIAVAKSAKSSLCSQLTSLIEQLPPHTRDPKDVHLSRAAFVFDPDDQARDVFENEIDAALRSLTGWHVTKIPSRHRWLIASDRDHYRVIVHAVAWRGSTPNTTVLPDHQSLDRLLVDIASAAYPTEAGLVGKWLGEMNAGATRHPWKSALHLWCALVEAKADEHSAPARFLHQNVICEPKARNILSMCVPHAGVAAALRAVAALRPAIEH